MRIKEGKIGCQESAAVVGISIYTSMIFTLGASDSYKGGNSTYIWMPAVAGASLGIVLFIMWAMEKSGVSTLDMLFKNAFGKLVGNVLSTAMIVLFLISAFELLADFVNMIHSFVFYDQPYWNIVLWIVATVGVLGFMGLECIGRTGRLLLPLFAVILLLWLILPIDSFSKSNLYPFPGNTPAEMANFMLKNAASAFAPLIAALTITNGLHGIKFTRNACGVGGICALAAAAATQLCLGLTYGYKDLLEMPYPIYRLDMMMPEEGYFFRMDKVALFFWLSMGIIASAYYVFCASILWCRCYGPKDTRPGVIAFSVLLACAVQIQAEGNYELFAKGMKLIDSWTWAAILMPAAAAAILLVKNKMIREKQA